MARGGGLLDHGRIALRCLIDRIDGAIDLLEAGHLLSRRSRDRAYPAADLLDMHNDRLQRFPGLADQINPISNLFAGRGDERLDFPRRLRRALGQFPNFLRDHGKALARFPGTDYLDPGIERQKNTCAGLKSSSRCRTISCACTDIGTI